MTPELEAALMELFVEGSTTYQDVKGLLETAIQGERDRCALIADRISLYAGNDAAGGAAHIISERIRGGMPPPEPPPEVTSGSTECVPCSGCGGIRKENCRDYGKHQHDWCDCQ